MSPEDWVEEGLCATLGPENWEALEPKDQRAVCGGCPVLEDCAQWAAGHRWTEITVAGITYGWSTRRKVPDQRVKV